jgi:hypothetical protein
VNRNIAGTSDWTLYSVKLPYPPDARIIYIGAILSGKGQLWVDDFELLMDGVSIDKVKQVPMIEYKADLDKEFAGGSGIRTLNPTGQNLKDLKMLGFIGFLILSPQYTSVVLLGFELQNNLKLLVGTEGERDAVFTEWINQLGQFESINETRIASGEIKLEPDLGWIINSGFSDDLSSLLLKVQNAKRTENHYYIGLVPEAGNPVFKNENAYPSMKFPDAGYRILALYRYWNIIQYYFPYKNLIEEDWKNILEEYIPKFIGVKNETEYTLTVLELIARVHDTHANIRGGSIALENYRGIHYSPVELKFIENKAVVTGFYDDKFGNETGLKIGDIISKSTTSG